jgi:hypothetical protein
MANTNRGFVIPAVIALIALLVAGGAYLAVKSRPQTSRNPYDSRCAEGQVWNGTGCESASYRGSNPNMAGGRCPDGQTWNGSDCISGNLAPDWKTYTNSQYGFSINYPQKYVFAKPVTSPGDVVQWFDSSKVFTNPEAKNLINISILSANGEPSFTDYISKYPILNGNTDRPFQFTPRVIGSNKFYYTQTERFEGTLSYDYYLLRGNALYRFSSVSQGVAWTDPDLDTENDSTHATLKEMLATLKFIPATANLGVSNWNTYVNPEYGFQIKYPQGSQINDMDITEGRRVAFAMPDGKYNSEMIIDLANKSWRNGTLVSPATCDDVASDSAVSHVRIDDFDFLRGDVSRDFSGMNSSFNVTGYCAVHNGISYKLYLKIFRPKNENVNENSVPELRQMLSTFEFTE